MVMLVIFKTKQLCGHECKPTYLRANTQAKCCCATNAKHSHTSRMVKTASRYGWQFIIHLISSHG